MNCKYNLFNSRRYTIKEYQNYTISDAIRYINADSISEEVPIDDLSAFIKSADTEQSLPTEQRVFFDIHFAAKNPVRFHWNPASYG